MPAQLYFANFVVIIDITFNSNNITFNSNNIDKMKSQIIFLSFVVLLFASACSSIKTTPETVAAITAKVESKDFTVRFNYANPFRMKQVSLTSEYTLKIKGDSAFAYLPYYGVAHVAPFNSSEGGIKFSSPMIEYSETANKRKDGWNIRFKINSGEYHYDLLLDVFKNGRSSLHVNSYERDPITFYGELM